MTGGGKNLVFRDVTWQRPFRLEDIHNVLTHVGSLVSRGFVVWEVRCKAGQVRYLLGTTARSISRIEDTFKAHGDVHFSECGERLRVIEAKKLKISKPILPLNTNVCDAMIRATLAAMTTARSDDEIVLQIVLGPAKGPSTVPAKLPDPNASWLDLLLGHVEPASADLQRSAREKAMQYGFQAMIRIGSSGIHAETRLYNIVSALRTLESAGVNIRATNEEPASLDHAAIPWNFPLLLSVRELACFMLLPAGEEELPGTPGLHPKLLLPPRWYREPLEKMARTFALSKQRPPRKLSISPRDALEHTVALGPTGSGKSTAMQSLILADIKAGKSVLICDPKADLCSSILERIPEERKDDVVVLDPSDPAPVGLNPLSYNHDPALTADTILAVFKELFSENWGIRTADVLAAALNTLCRIPGATLLWLIPLLTDDTFRAGIVKQIHDPIGLDNFWRHYEEMSPRERNTEISPVLNKLRQISMRPGLRNVLGQSQPKFSLTELFTKRKIVLVPLNRGLIGGESARLLGSLIVGLTWSLALSRANVAPEKRHPVMIYIDELQDYLALPTSFSDALAQARGLGVGYTVAHQYRGQLPPDIKAGIDANVRNKIIFGLSSNDAKDMAAQAPELTALDFMTLPRYEVYASFQSGGKSTGWVSGKTLPPPPPLRMAAELKAESMARYGVPAEQVEADYLSLISHPKPNPDPAVTDAPIGRRKKTNSNGEKL